MKAIFLAAALAFLMFSSEAVACSPTWPELKVTLETQGIDVIEIEDLFVPFFLDELRVYSDIHDADQIAVVMTGFPNIQVLIIDGDCLKGIAVVPHELFNAIMLAIAGVAA